MPLRKLTLLAVVLVATLLGLFACQSQDTTVPPTELPEQAERLPVIEEVEATTATVYYVTTDKKYLLPLNISINATKEVATVAMEKLLAGPPNSFAGAVLPADTKLLDLYSINDTIYVNLTKDIEELSKEDSRLAVESILCTILPLAEGYRLQILVEGRPVEQLGAVDVSAPLALPFINLRESDRARLAAGESGLPLIYYLADDMAMYLVPQTIFYWSEEDSQNALSREEASYAYTVLQEMLAAPAEDSGLSSPFWGDTALLDISVDTEGVAYCDFSADLRGPGGGTAYEAMLLGCLTHTLCGLPGISAVQILIEGNDQASLPEGSDLSRPLTPGTPLNSVN